MGSIISVFDARKIASRPLPLVLSRRKSENTQAIFPSCLRGGVALGTAVYDHAPRDIGPDVQRLSGCASR